ncbi:hypothetical protein AB0C77_13740 [Streptomyces sp. NPDC048629]|uniref:hypothetical protein n=1 Tax=Streptomyces sp. NPDC048629 TaxID=3154824 RepID=UPI00343FDFE9
MSDDLFNPAALWPSPTTPAKAPPRRWVWTAMEPADRRERLRELATWVDWLRVTFELHNNIPGCWYRHPSAVEHLTALYLGWVRTYAGPQEPGRGLGEAEWINTLHALIPRLSLPACATSHEPSPPRAAPTTSTDLQVFLDTSPTIAAPIFHPAEAEARRLVDEADPPL